MVVVVVVVVVVVSEDLTAENNGTVAPGARVVVVRTGCVVVVVGGGDVVEVSVVVRATCPKPPPVDPESSAFFVACEITQTNVKTAIKLTAAIAPTSLNLIPGQNFRGDGMGTPPCHRKREPSHSGSLMSCLLRHADSRESLKAPITSENTWSITVDNLSNAFVYEKSVALISPT